LADEEEGFPESPQSVLDFGEVSVEPSSGIGHRARSEGPKVLAPMARPEPLTVSS
jgi:hypothetical protein